MSPFFWPAKHGSEPSHEKSPTCTLYLDLFLLQAGVPSRALDVGCAVGRSSFELTKAFDEVIGVDYSKQFVAACDELKGAGHMVYSMTTEGLLGQKFIANVDTTLVGLNFKHLKFKCTHKCRILFTSYTRWVEARNVNLFG